ncbi:MAG: putative toxin-antitoxin system toxin component, PIN family [Ginsengibacter sp.]
MKNKNVKIIFDTNVWISFLIGKRLSGIKEYIADGRITIVTTGQLIKEIQIVTARDKIKKYFPRETVCELIELLETIAEKIEIQPTHFINREREDNFILDLIEYSKVNYLVTGDKNLLEHIPFKTAEILTPKEFEEQFDR